MNNAIVPATIEHVEELALKLRQEDVKEVWDINPAVTTTGAYPLLHENGLIGSFMKGLFGYNGNPSLLEVLFYISYLFVIFYVYRKIDSKITVKT